MRIRDSVHPPRDSRGAGTAHAPRARLFRPAPSPRTDPKRPPAREARQREQQHHVAGDSEALPTHNRRATSRSRTRRSAPSGRINSGDRRSNAISSVNRRPPMCRPDARQAGGGSPPLAAPSERHREPIHRDVCATDQPSSPQPSDERIPETGAPDGEDVDRLAECGANNYRLQRLNNNCWSADRTPQLLDDIKLQCRLSAAE
jgi:hypothetical protein